MAKKKKVDVEEVVEVKEEVKVEEKVIEPTQVVESVVEDIQIPLNDEDSYMLGI